MLRALLLTVALVSGGASAWLVSASTSSETGAEERTAMVTTIEMPEVLVAVGNVEQGGQLAAEHMRWQPWPSDAVTGTYITRAERPAAVDELTGSVLRGKLVPGEPIVAEKLAPPGSSLLSAVLSPGKRAVAIAISAAKTAGGFVLPNDRVDVVQILPCRPEEGCNGGMSVRTILRNVRVLAIDQSGQQTDSKGVLIGKTATLELDPPQAEILVGAEASGVLSLVLRSSADHAETAEAGPKKQRTVRVWREGVAEYVKVQ